jgi:NAD(P)-dependent dehydrogenase (short-subunit alcohol dehydrogenase family)
MLEQANLTGSTALVTGATGGIGKQIALGLGRLGAHVIVGARNADRGEATRAEIAAAGGDASVIKLDVASFESIHAAADEVNRRYDKLQILVNNAGAWFSDRKLSADGHELTFATNVLGPHLLNRLLRPKLEISAPARIVNVVSGFASEYDATDLEWERRKWAGFSAYKQSKQALRMITWGLAARLAGTGVTVNAAAPGFVKTDFNQNAHGFLAGMLGVMAKLFAVRIEKGAETPLWVATSPELAGQTGKYYDALREKDGKFHEPAPIADLERRLDEMIARARVRAA